MDDDNDNEIVEGVDSKKKNKKVVGKDSEELKNDDSQLSISSFSNSDDCSVSSEDSNKMVKVMYNNNQ